MRMSKYHLTVGLEVHAELKTTTKMFCSCRNDPDAEHPNVNVCPICMGHPGTLPTINKQAVAHVLSVGAAAGGELADFSEFDRKSYFYPDIPKGYQISQYAYPLVRGGSINGVTLTRIHLEEDTARSTHDKGERSLVDFNRSGVPLMELVTEPDMHTPEEVGAFARELQLLLRYLGAGDANMEKGEMRVEANISVSPEPNTLGTKVEVKNLNSFKAVERAIAYELTRQSRLLDRGDEILQQTLGWDEAKQQTFAQRSKEDSHDYRYFPDPDLPKLKLSELPELEAEAISAALPELPWQARERYVSSLGLHPTTADTLVADLPLRTFFDQASRGVSPEERTLIANYLTSDLNGLISAGECGRSVLVERDPAEFASLIGLVNSGEISSRGAKDTLLVWVKEGGDPRQLAEREGLLQVSDAHAMQSLAREVITEHPDVVETYQGGKEQSLKFLVGQGMKRSKGSANPAMLEKALRELITTEQAG
jgi:aspartyl-tRNA(Asn)/glutamyl-tRNA(Gln) amidotransferase subunit B